MASPATDLELHEGFRAFVAAANEKGIGVIQDMVPNHIGDGHWWLQDLPGDDWLMAVPKSTGANTGGSRR